MNTPDDGDPRVDPADGDGPAWSAAWDRRLDEQLRRGPDPQDLLDLSRELEARAAPDDPLHEPRRRRLERALLLARTALDLATWRALRWLTALVTLALPLLLMAAWYGMNFAPHASPWAMPELTSWWGYPLALALAVLLLLAGLVVLRRARWRQLHGGRDDR